MQRKIVEPADVSGAALAELKSWLGITRPNEDALLTNLLHSSLAMCEAFTGQAPLSQVVEERLPTQMGSATVSPRPVLGTTDVSLIAQTGERSPLDPSQFKTQLQPDGTLVFELLQNLEGQTVALTMQVGLAQSWEMVPTALKQGMIRLCAHYYRDRDRPGSSKKVASPPAIVSALWRPWQVIRLT